MLRSGDKGIPNMILVKVICYVNVENHFLTFTNHKYDFHKDHVGHAFGTDKFLFKLFYCLLLLQCKWKCKIQSTSKTWNIWDWVHVGFLLELGDFVFSRFLLTWLISFLLEWERLLLFWGVLKEEKEYFTKWLCCERVPGFCFFTVKSWGWSKEKIYSFKSFLSK